MSKWQPIETAPTGKLVKLGGWFEDYGRIGEYHQLAPPPKWSEGYGLVFADVGTHRKRICDPRVTHWQPLDLTPPTQED